MKKNEISWQDVGNRVALARSIREITQSELARRIELDRTAIAKIESGSRGISAIELTRLASALEVPLTWLVSDSYAAIVSHRQEGLLPGTDGEIGLILEKLGSNIELLIELKQLTSCRVEEIAISPPSSFDEAEQAAYTIRKLLNNHEEPITNLSHVAEQLGVYAFVIEEISPSFDGAYLALEVGGVALINGFHESGRRRFTLAHEIGHHIFQDEYVSDWTLGDTTEQTEKYVNAFAIHLLLPRRGIRKHWEMHNGSFSPRIAALHIAVNFQVSWSAVCTHLMNLGLVDNTLWTELTAHLPRPGEFMEYGLTILEDLLAPSIPSKYSSAVITAYKKNKISAERAIELLYETIEIDDLPLPDRIPLEALTGGLGE